MHPGALHLLQLVLIQELVHRLRRALGTIDNRGSHFYLALYWAEELAKQTEDADLAAAFASLASTLRDNEKVIVEELLAVQGKPADVGGYFRPDAEKAAAKEDAARQKEMEKLHRQVEKQQEAEEAARQRAAERRTRQVENVLGSVLRTAGREIRRSIFGTRKR